MLESYQALINDIQHNCHISDARHAGNYTLCVYLLKMREFYRWEHRQRFADEPGKEAIGQWLSAREALWEQLEDEDFRPLQLPGSPARHDPFDAPALNRHLIADGLIYSGGYGVKNKPHFFIARLEQQQQYNGYHIYLSGEEYARDLTAPPAMSQQQTIYIRRESFKRMIWERTEEWRWNRPANAMARAIACYDFDTDVDQALDAMTASEIDAAILHEIGEIQAGETLPGWQEMMQAISFTQAEIMARAVRDHYADTLHTLPALLGEQRAASIHFYFANLTSMRKHLFPSLMQAYQHWCEHGELRPLQKQVDSALDHWRSLARQMLAIHHDIPDGRECARRIEALVNASKR